MALLRYMKPVDGLPYPRGALRIRRFRRQLEPRTEVNVVLTSGTALRAEIAKYACQHGASVLFEETRETVKQ